MTTFAARTAWSLEPNALTQAVAARRAGGHALLDLTESNPTRCGFQYPAGILEALQDAQNLRYEPQPRGLPGARAAVAAAYAAAGRPVAADQILLTSGTSEGYAWLFRLLVGLGEQVLVPRPGYPLLDYLAALHDVRLDPYPLRYLGAWGLDHAGVAGAIRTTTRAICLIHPHNPTGWCATPDDVRQLTRLAQAHELALIVDEVFLDYGADDGSRAVGSLAGTDEVLTCVLGGVSKACGLPQMKVGWLVVTGPRRVVDQALARLEVIADAYLSVSTPAQRALGVWLRDGSVVRDQIRARIVANRRWLNEAVRGRGRARVLVSPGGWYAVLAVEGVEDSEGWALQLLETEGVLVHPGYLFDFPETQGPGAAESFMVVSLLPPPDVFREGIQRVLRRVGEG